MCGIGGVWGGGSVLEPARIGRIFADALAHRGPDGEGFLAVPADATRLARSCDRASLSDDVPLRGLLVHRRLSIIDLRTGDQPMGSGGGRFWIVYNGEIYNFRELREEIGAAEREAFVTTSDTEVILRVYRRWGIDGFRRLNGIFAFALFDAGKNELVLARDPLGVKPLYFTRRDNVIAFASEVRPLIAAGFVGSGVDPEAIAQYLYFRFVPSPRTAWRDVRKLRPGFALSFDCNGRLLGEHDFAGSAPTTTDRPGAVLATLPDQLRVVVRRQMIADVPVGAFLSGGLDSCMVVSAARDVGAVPLTFGIGFPDNENVANEMASGAEASRFLGVPFEGTPVTAESYFAGFPSALVEVEEPLAQAGMHLLSLLAASAAHRVKVVLTGQGADEPLAGYLRHQATRVALLLRAIVPREAVRHWRSSHEGAERFLRILGSGWGSDLAAAPFGTLTPEEAGRNARGCMQGLGPELVREAVSVWWAKSEGLDDLSRILYVDVRTSLADDLLLMGDKTAMAHGLEARVPFLDLEYLATLEGLPGTFRVPLWRRRKWIQHEVGGRILPPALARRLLGSRSPFSRKRGFEVPMALWLRQRFAQGLLSMLAGRGSMLPQYVDERYVRSVVTRYLAGKSRHYRTVLALYVLELWLRLNVAGVPPAELPTPGREFAGVPIRGTQ